MTTARKLALACFISLACVAIFLYWKKAPDEAAKAKPSRTEKLTTRTGLTKHAKPNIHNLKKASFAGTLRDDQGASIDAAHICVFASSDALSTQQTLAPNCTYSNADGRYSFTALVPAHYEVSASKVGFVPGHYEFEDEDGKESHYLTLTEGESRDQIDMVLMSGGAELTGIVQDIGGGPIVGAWVVIGSGSWTQRSQVTVQTKEDGRFSAWVMEGRIRATASAEGYSDGNARGLAPGVHGNIDDARICSCRHCR